MTKSRPSQELPRASSTLVAGLWTEDNTPDCAQTLALVVPISVFVALILFFVHSKEMVQHPLNWSFAWALLIIGTSSCGTLFAISLNKRKCRAMAVVVMFVCGVLGGYLVGELIRGFKGEGLV
jgi:hypothetical protein